MKGKEDFKKTIAKELSIIGKGTADVEITGDIHCWRHWGKDDNGKEKGVRFRDACMTKEDENKIKEFQVTVSFPPLDVTADIHFCKGPVINLNKG